MSTVSLIRKTIFGYFDEIFRSFLGHLELMRDHH